MRRTRGSETSQYPEEETSNEIPSVAASEGGRAQTNPTTKKTGKGKGTEEKQRKGKISLFFLLYLYLITVFLVAVFFVVGLGL
jgi:hypothetical protein